MRQPNRAFRLRLAVLLGLLVIAVGASILIAVSVARDARGTVEQLADIELEAARLAREFRAAVDDLHGVLLRLGIDPTEDNTATIEQRKRRLERWLTQRLAAARSFPERHVLERLQMGALAYFRKIDGLGARPEGWAAPLDRATVVAFDDTAIRLQSLADVFAERHDEGLRELATTAVAELVWLRNLVFGCLALLVAATAAVTVMLYRDVVRPLRTQLIANETLLEQREKLAALGTLAAGVAHEIRNPLTAIKARLYTLRRATASTEAREDLQAIGTEIDRLERIVRDVLGYARPGDPALDDLELSGWLRDLAVFLRPDLARAGIQLTVESEPPVQVRADPSQLRQVVLNLVRNAQEAIGGKPGRIVLAARCERLALRGRMAEAVVMSVTDDGPGIPADIQSRLFDPFFTTKPNGTGLGLSIVAKLVESHGGEIGLQTGPRAGTQIAIRLPAAKSAAS